MNSVFEDICEQIEEVSFISMYWDDGPGKAWRSGKDPALSQSSGTPKLY